jgi:hypothetical protein
MIDLGSVHERGTAIFTVTVAQYAPAAVHGEEDHVMVCGCGIRLCGMCCALCFNSSLS